MNKLLIGAHMSVAGGYHKAYDDAHTIGASAIQIFAKSPMQSKLRAITEDEAKAVRESAGYDSVKAMVIHASYLLNFAKKMEEDSYQVKSLAEDVMNAAMLGGQGAVVHMGKVLGGDPLEAEDLYVKNIGIVLEQTKGVKAKVILENTAGQGSEMGYRLEEYGRIFKRLTKNHSRIGSCIDTAHLFGGGYDLSTEKGAQETVRAIEENIGIAHLTCIHFNDSKKPLGSRVDRHQDLDHGTIKAPGLKAFAKTLHKERHDIPFVLETPEEHTTYAEQIAQFRSWF